MYCLIEDDDGHWFIIPADKRIQTWDYFEKLYKYWEEMPDDEKEPEEPEWLNPVNTSISYVVFPSYNIDFTNSDDG